MRKPKQYSGEELETLKHNGLSVELSATRHDRGGRRSSTEQSVSERGQTPVFAQDVRQEAETRKNQVQQDFSKTDSRLLDSYVVSVTLPT
jgi:serine/threonine-protein kinase PRP4